MAQDFRIELGVVTNLKPAEKQVQEFIRKQGNKEFTLTPKISTKGINEFRDQFKGIQTEVKLAQAELDKFTQYNEKIATSKINDSLRDVAKVLGDIKAPVKETSTSFDKWVDSQGKLITQTRKFDNELGTVITRVEQYKNELGQTVTETTTFNDSWEKLAHNMDVVDDRVARAAEEEKKLAEAEKLAAKEAKANTKVTATMGDTVERTSAHTETLANKIITAAGKVALFKVSTTAVMAFYNSISKAKQAVVDFDAAMVEFNKVTPLSNSEIEKMMDSFDELSKEVGRTKTELLEVATEMTKSGFGTSTTEVTKMAELVSLYQNTADEELSAAEASAVLISQMKAFGYEADNAIHILDSINKVSAEFAVSSGDIGRGLTQAGAALQTYGNTFDEVVGMVTGATEIFSGRSQQVARG